MANRFFMLNLKVFFFAFIAYSPFSNSLAAFADESRLITACKAGNNKTVMNLLKAGANPNGRDASGFTPLMYSSINGDLETSMMLILMGADTNLKNSYGGTALMYAAGNGNFEIAYYLLKNKARVNAVALDGDSALTIVRRLGFSQIESLLLGFGADKRISIYWWIDDKGIDRYTDNKNEVPMKYRTEVTRLDPQRDIPKHLLVDSPEQLKEIELGKYRNRAEKEKSQKSDLIDSFGKDLSASQRSMLHDTVNNQYKKNTSDLESYKQKVNYDESPEGQAKVRERENQFETEQRQRDIEQKIQHLESELRSQQFKSQLGN